jgi:hypothetical protein
VGFRNLPEAGVSRKSGMADKALERDAAEQIAIAALGHIAADSDRLDRFLALTGLAPDRLRQAAAEPGFFQAVLDHIGGHEPDLLAFAAESGISPERIAAARRILAGEFGTD